MPKTYAIIDENNTILNIIIWDGVSPYTPPIGTSVVLLTDELLQKQPNT